MPILEKDLLKMQERDVYFISSRSFVRMLKLSSQVLKMLRFLQEKRFKKSWLLVSPKI